MLNKKHNAMGMIAALVATLLATFGISRIGGETWTSAAASSEAGWRAYTGRVTPPPVPVIRAFLVPLTMVLTVIAVAVVAAILKRYASGRSEEAPTTPPAER